MGLYNTICTDLGGELNVQTAVESSTANAWDKAVQVIRLNQNVTGQLVWPENTETGVRRGCNILDLGPYNILGNGQIPINYQDTEVPLYIKGSGLISAAAALTFSGSGTNSATLTTAQQGTGSTGTVTVAVANADLEYPANSSFVPLISARNGSNSGAMISNAYAYYPNYYVGPTMPPAISTSNPSGWTPSTGFRLFQTQLQQDIGGTAGNSFGSSAAFGRNSNIAADRMILRITHNGVTVDLVNNSGAPGTFRSGSGTVTLTNFTTQYGGQGGQVPIPGGTIQSRTITWTVNPSGAASFDIVARYATRANQDGSTTNYDSAWYFGLGDVTTQLPANSMMRLPLTGSYSNNRSFTVTNNNSIQLTFNAGASPNQTTMTVPANNSASPTVITNPGTSTAWDFTASAPATTAFRYPESGNNTGSGSVDVGQGTYRGNGDVDVTVNPTIYTYDTTGRTVNFGGSIWFARDGGVTTENAIVPQVPSTDVDGNPILGIRVGTTFIAAGTRLTPAQTETLIGDPTSSSINLISAYISTRGTVNPNAEGTYTVSSSGGNFRLTRQTPPLGSGVGQNTGSVPDGWGGAGYTLTGDSSPRLASQVWYTGTTTGAGFVRFRTSVGYQPQDSDNNPARETSVKSWSVFGSTQLESVGEFRGVSSIRVRNVTTVRQGTRFTTTNANTVPITFNRANGGTFTVPANTTAQQNNFNDTETRWNFTGLLGTTSTAVPGEPLANLPSFVDNTAIDLDGNGTVTRGINVTEFNGSYARTG